MKALTEQQWRRDLGYAWLIEFQSYGGALALLTNCKSR